MLETLIQDVRWHDLPVPPTPSPTPSPSGQIPRPTEKELLAWHELVSFRPDLLLIQSCRHLTATQLFSEVNWFGPWTIPITLALYRMPLEGASLRRAVNQEHIGKEMIEALRTGELQTTARTMVMRALQDEQRSEITTRAETNGKFHPSWVEEKSKALSAATILSVDARNNRVVVQEILHQLVPPHLTYIPGRNASSNKYWADGLEKFVNERHQGALIMLGSLKVVNPEEAIPQLTIDLEWLSKHTYPRHSTMLMQAMGNGLAYWIGNKLTSQFASLHKSLMPALQELAGRGIKGRISLEKAHEHVISAWENQSKILSTLDERARLLSDRPALTDTPANKLMTIASLGELIIGVRGRAREEEVWEELSYARQAATELSQRIMQPDQIEASQINQFMYNPFIRPGFRDNLLMLYSRLSPQTMLRVYPWIKLSSTLREMSILHDADKLRRLCQEVGWCQAQLIYAATHRLERLEGKIPNSLQDWHPPQLIPVILRIMQTTGGNWQDPRALEMLAEHQAMEIEKTIMEAIKEAWGKPV